jgi:hypothetical protein
LATLDLTSAQSAHRRAKGLSLENFNFSIAEMRHYASGEDRQSEEKVAQELDQELGNPMSTLEVNDTVRVNVPVKDKAEPLSTRQQEFEVTGNRSRLENFGFKVSEGGAHISRTIMLKEITRLLASSPAEASIDDYNRAVVESNVLGKATETTKQKTLRHLRELYGLSAALPIFSIDPRAHEFSAQLRAFDAAKSGSALGVAALLALCSALLEKSLKGGMVVVGGLNLGGSIEPVFNASTLVKIAVEKGAAHVLMPISARKQLNDLPDDVLTKVTLFYYSDPRDALIKGLAE